MKKILSITAIALLFTMFSCNKEECKSMTVVRDCTGTYLRLDGKDFHVCNEEKLSSFSSGTNITASFKTIENCKALEEKFVCKMYHKNEGWIEVVNLK
jgi:hypothetical protein